MIALLVALILLGLRLPRFWQKEGLGASLAWGLVTGVIISTVLFIINLAFGFNETGELGIALSAKLQDLGVTNLASFIILGIIFSLTHFLKKHIGDGLFMEV